MEETVGRAFTAFLFHSDLPIKSFTIQTWVDEIGNHWIEGIWYVKGKLRKSAGLVPVEGTVQIVMRASSQDGWELEELSENVNIEGKPASITKPYGQGGYLAQFSKRELSKACERLDSNTVYTYGKEQ